MKYINLEEFESLLTSENFTLTFSADWCPPCKVLQPTLEKLASEVDYQVVKVDTDEVPELAKRFMVKGIPATFHFKDGKIHKQTVGAVSLDKLKELAL